MLTSLHGVFLYVFASQTPTYLMANSNVFLFLAFPEPLQSKGIAASALFIVILFWHVVRFFFFNQEESVFNVFFKVGSTLTCFTILKVQKSNAFTLCAVEKA